MCTAYLYEVSSMNESREASQQAGRISVLQSDTQRQAIDWQYHERS